MSKRTWSMLLVVVALLALLPHLPVWYPVARDAVLGFRFAAILPPLILASQVTREWLAGHARLVEIACGGALLLTALTLAVRRLKARRRNAVGAAMLVMPERVTPRPGTTLAERTSHPQPVAAPADAELRRPPRPSGVMQPAERESRRAMVGELFRNGRSVSEIARLTGIGQDAIRAAVHEPRSA